MANNCDLSLINIENANKQAVTAFKLDADDAVISLIGIPKKGDKLHNDFYNDMYNYFMKSGDNAHYDLDPWVMGTQWRNYFNDVFVDDVNPDSIKISKHRLKSMYVRFKKIRDKREKAFGDNSRKDGMSNSARALLPPSILAMRNDRYGFISKLVKSTKEMADKIKQSYARFDSDVSKVAKRFLTNARGLYDLSDKSAVLDGLSMQDGEGRLITVHDRKLNANGKPTLQVTFKDREYREDDNGMIVPNKKWIAMSTLKINEEMYKSAYINKYTDDFVNDILHGQTRFVKWHSFSEARDDANILIEAEMQLLSHRVNTKRKNVTNRSRKFKQTSITIKDPNNPNKTLWSGVYSYVMIKDGQGQGKEVYNSYLTGVKPDGGEYLNEKDSKYQLKNGGINEFQLVRDALRDGYYTSNQTHVFTNHQKRLSVDEIKAFGLNNGDKLSKERYLAHLNKLDEADALYPENSQHKAYVEFNYMEKQPDPEMTEEKVLEEGDANYANMWELVSQYRNTYQEVGKDIKKFGKRTQNKRAKVESNIRAELKKKGLKPDEIKIWMEENIYKVGGLESRIWEDKRTGTIHTPDSTLELKQENYAPIKWNKGNFFKMLDRTIFEIQKRLQDEASTLDENSIAELQEDLKEFQEMAHATADRIPNEKMIDQAMSIHKKQRKLWTDPVTRRKGAQVHVDYLDDTYRNLHKNELMIDLIEQMHNVIRTDAGLAEDSIDYMVNRVKLATGKNDTNVSVPTPLGWAQWSNTKVAHMMNKLPEWFKRGRVWDADGVEPFWLTTNGLLTMKFLGPGGAIGNRTQSLNNIIAWGWKSHQHMREELETNSDYWNDVVDGTGVLNLISVFNDVMLQGGDVQFSDAGFAPLMDEILMKGAFGASIPVPTKKFVDWRRVAKAGKPAWIKNGSKSIDLVLLKLMQGNLTKDEKADAQYGRELDSVINEFNNTDGGYDIDSMSDSLKREVQIRRGAYWDLQMTNKDENRREILEKRFRALMGDVKDNQLRKMVTFKLSYWATGYGKKLFTFTHGEQQMRKETAVQALLVAEAKGLLGNKGSRADRMKSPDAIRIARNAVYQMMFGMSPVHLGEMFSGVGRTLAQYKSYPLFQHIKDHNTMTNFTNGGDATSRLFKEFNRMIRFREYNVQDVRDHEAAAAARLILTRGVSSIIVATISMMSVLQPIIRGVQIKGGVSLSATMRSTENPLFGTAYRSILWATMFMMGWGEEEERDKVADDTANRISFLFVPAIIGAFARWGYDFYKKGDENEGIWQYL